MAPVTYIFRDDTPHSAAYLAENQSAKILAITGTLCFLSVLTVLLRTYVRAFLSRCIGWEDVCIIITAVLGIATWICFIGESFFVIGRHAAAITKHEYEMFLLWTFPHFLFSVLEIMMAKVSVALLLIRIDSRPNYRKTYYAIIAFVMLYSLVCASSIFWSCYPLSANWNLDEKAIRRIPDNVWLTLFTVNSAFNMATDVALAILPITLVLSLRVDMRTKIGLAIVLSLGLCVVICCGIKTYYQCIYFEQKDKYFDDSYYLWSAVEIYVAIIVASLPTLKPLWTVVSKRVRGSFTCSKSNETPAGVHHGDDDGSPIPIRKPVIEWTGMGFTTVNGAGGGAEMRGPEVLERPRLDIIRPGFDSSTTTSSEGLEMTGAHGDAKFVSLMTVDSIMASSRGWTSNSTTVCHTDDEEAKMKATTGASVEAEEARSPSVSSLSPSMTLPAACDDCSRIAKARAKSVPDARVATMATQRASLGNIFRRQQSNTSENSFAFVLRSVACDGGDLQQMKAEDDSDEEKKQSSKDDAP